MQQETSARGRERSSYCPADTAAGTSDDDIRYRCVDDDGLKGISHDATASARFEFPALLLFVTLPQLFVGRCAPKVRQAAAGQIPDCQRRAVVCITGIDDAVEPDEHPPPQVRARCRNIGRRRLINVFPRVFIDFQDFHVFG